MKVKSSLDFIFIGIIFVIVVLFGSVGIDSGIFLVWIRGGNSYWVFIEMFVVVLK